MRLPTSRTLLFTAVSSALFATAPSHAQQLEEIVVTAQKRAESLQDAPLAISAYSEESLENYGIADMSDLVLSTPTLNAYDFPTSTSNVSLFLRGFGNTDSQTLTVDNPVGVYIDGVYIARTTGATVDVIDLERVEILRGPQGTLYGRNSTAGAISFISKKPSEEFGGSIKASLGNFGYQNLAGSVDAPISDSLRSKFSIQTSSTDGWVENKGPNAVAQDSEDFYAHEQIAYRAAFSWDINEDITLDYSYDYADVDSNPPYYQQDASKRQENTSHLFLGGAAYQYVLPTNTTETSGHNITLNVALSDNLQLKSITGYREMQERAVQNWSDSLFFATDIDWGTDALSQEIQLIGSTESIQYIAGIYYFEEEGYKAEEQFTNASSGAFDALAAPLVGSSVTLGGNNLGTHTVDTDLKSTAVFAQATFAATEQLDITAGIRYTDDSRDAVRGVAANNPSIQFPPGSNGLDYTRTDWSLTADYQIDENSSTYAKVATGYRAGGSGEKTLAFDQTFDEETAISYEFGYKAELLDKRLRVNAAVFRTEFEDLLLTISGEPPQFASFVEVFNAGQTTYDGVELDITALLAEKTLLTFSYAYLDTSLEDVVVPQSSFLKGGAPASAVNLRGVDISNSSFIAFAPEQAYTIALDHAIATEMGEVQLHINYAWRDELFSQPGQGLPVDSLGLLNARVSLNDIKVGDQSLNVALWAKNLTDEEEVVYNLANFGFQYNEPMTFGIDAKFSF